MGDIPSVQFRLSRGSKMKFLSSSYYLDFRIVHAFSIDKMVL